jgi:DNA polymerase III alpha subunit
MQYDKIISVEYFGEDETYDLEVDHPDHTFFANDISVSNSHAVSYAINSYLCAWLLTYYEPEWLCAYMETQLNNPDEKAKAISELKSFGYDFAKIEINKATDHWTIVEGDKKLMPSFLSCKGVGKTAVDEIINKRPYDDIYSFLWEDDGSWKHSKFNKKNIDVLIKISAFDSLGCIGEGKLFKNYAHMHRTIVDNWTLLRKKLKKDTFDTQCQKLDNLAAETNDDNWSLDERLEIYKDLMGEVNLDMIIPKSLQKKLDDKGYCPIDAMPEENGGSLCWFVLEDWEKRKTKHGKAYANLSVSGLSGRQESIKVWDWDESVKFCKNTGYRAYVEKDHFGMKAKINQIFEIPR